MKDYQDSKLNVLLKKPLNLKHEPIEPSIGVFIEKIILKVSGSLSQVRVHPFVILFRSSDTLEKQMYRNFKM